MKKTAVLLGVFFFLLIPAWAARNDNPHDFQSVGCNHCHIMIPGKSKTVQRNVFRKNIDDLCQECHAATLEDNLNHRVGIRPSMRVPEDLHLSPNGELSCITCHDPHTTYLDRKQKNRTFFLRRRMLKRELCLACHRERSYEEPKITFEILSPINNSMFSDLPAPLIGKVSSSGVREVMLQINDSQFILNVKNRVFSTVLTLKEGVNKISLSADKVNQTEVLNLFYDPDIPQEMTYRLYQTHGIINKKDCYVCHRENTDTYLIADNNSFLCKKCHELKRDSKYLHGPVAVGSCTVCHDPHGNTNPNLLVMTGEELCFQCHIEERVLRHLLRGAGDKSFLRDKGCGFCHDPHQGNREFLLRL